MDRFYKLHPKYLIPIFIALSIICTGMGMGVPIFNILFGFIIGWFAARRALGSFDDIGMALKKILYYLLFCSGFTFLTMAAIWGRVVPMIFAGSSDFTDFGIPMILFDPKLSFIGWIILMIVISPFLQLLTSIFSGYLVVAFKQVKK